MVLNGKYTQMMGLMKFGKVYFWASPLIGTAGPLPCRRPDPSGAR
jgi:hypothetical protein